MTDRPLRGALNLGNVALVKAHGDGTFSGAAPALAERIGARLGRPVVLTAYPHAAAIVALSGDDAWDMAFIAVEPSRLDRISYAKPYAQVQIGYAVPEQSPLDHADAVDAPGIRVASTRTAAYDALLRRILRHATLLSSDDRDGAGVALLEGRADCLAGLTQALEAFVAAHPGYRLLPGLAAAIDQAVAVPKGGEALIPAIDAAIDELG